MGSGAAAFGEFSKTFLWIMDRIPLRAPDEVLKKVCPAVVIVCGRDIRMSREAYAARLKALVWIPS